MRPLPEEFRLAEILRTYAPPGIAFSGLSRRYGNNSFSWDFNTWKSTAPVINRER